jgi:hypothetical protein
MGKATELPDRETMHAYLSSEGLDGDSPANLWQGVSRARDNDPGAPRARYFVIHDTSGPNFGRSHWPPDFNENAKINSLARHRCSDGWETAHAFINRAGAMLVGHDFSVPWRGTKFERATRFGTDLKGLFIHIELVQPRRRDVRRGRRDDSIAPVPGFTPAQYRRLALLYVIASVRGGHWLVPAFHAAIDGDIRNGHDDPQNFDLAAFATSLEGLLQTLRRRERPLISLAE